MPSPVAHSLIGLAIAAQYAVAPAPLHELKRNVRKNAGTLLAGVALANAPDIDYVPGIISGDLNAYHHYYTHSIGWIVLVAMASWLLWRTLQPAAGGKVFAFIFAALGSHLLADWVTQDARPPFGIMAFWPLSDRFFIAPVAIFCRLHKRDWSELFQWNNAGAILAELAVCVPLVLVVMLLKVRDSPNTKRAPCHCGAPV